MAKAKSEKKSRRRSYRMKAHRRHHKRELSLVNALGLGLGEYVTVTAGDTMSLVDSVKAGGSNLARQQIIGMTGYDIETGGWVGTNALRFWGPVIGMKILQVVGKKLVGPVRLMRGIKLF